jgi:hypothetical protein
MTCWRIGSHANILPFGYYGCFVCSHCVVVASNRRGMNPYVVTLFRHTGKSPWQSTVTEIHGLINWFPCCFCALITQVRVFARLGQFGKGWFD